MRGYFLSTSREGSIQRLVWDISSSEAPFVGVIHP